MTQFDEIITVGFDKNGEADFRIKGTIIDLSLERMNELRSMIPVAIGSAEDMWRRNRSHHAKSGTICTCPKWGGEHQPECALKARSETRV
jgi:hypothetical protein